MTMAQQYAPPQDYGPDPYEEASTYDSTPPAYADAPADPSMGGEAVMDVPEGVTDINPTLDAATAVEDGQASFMPPAEQNAGDGLMTAADEDLTVVDEEASASMNVGSGDVLGDSFAGGTDNQTPDNQAVQPQAVDTSAVAPPQMPPDPKDLDLSGLPQQGNASDDSLMAKINGLFGNKKEDDAMASITEAADQYKLQEQNVAAQNAGMDRSLEYRGVPQQQNFMRGGRGNMQFRR